VLSGTSHLGKLESASYRWVYIASY